MAMFGIHAVGNAGPSTPSAAADYGRDDKFVERINNSPHWILSAHSVLTAKLSQSCISFQPTIIRTSTMKPLFVEAGRDFIRGDFAVADVDDAMGILGDVRFVGDDDDGVAPGVQFVDERHDLNAGF